jgi:hypothetical protein
VEALSRVAGGMKKEYIYDSKGYFTHITLTAYFCIVIVLVSAGMIIAGYNRSVFALIALVAGYTVWNTFISRSNPSRVILEEDGISFEAYGKTTKYLFTDIKSFLAKDFRGSGKIFLRVNKSSLLRGRYWIHTKECNDSDELYLYILKLEHQTHPNNMKARAWDSTRPEVDKTPALPWNLPDKEKTEVKR